MRLLTAEEVAGILQVPKARVYELIRLKRLPSVHVGRLVRVPEEDFRAWIATGGSPLPPRCAILDPSDPTAPPRNAEAQSRPGVRVERIRPPH